MAYGVRPSLLVRKGFLRRVEVMHELDSSEDLCCVSSSLFLQATALFSENSCYLHFNYMYLAK